MILYGFLWNLPIFFCFGTIMDVLENIIVATLAIVMTSLIAVLYHIRQLYATAPVMFQQKSDSGYDGVFQIVVTNRGNQVEENIELEIDPSITFEIVAASVPGVMKDGSTIRIERIHRKNEVIILISTVDIHFGSAGILSVSSNNVSGRVCKTPKDIPFNYGMTSLAILLLLSAFPVGYYLYQVAGYVEDKVDEVKLAPVSKEGWSNLDEYQESDLRKSYSNQEFPIRLSDIKKKQDYDSGSVPVSLKDEWGNIDNEKDALLHYEINNKTAGNLGVMAYRRNGNRTLPYFAEVAPLSKGVIIVPVRGQTDSGNVQVEFLFRLNDEWLEKIVHSIDTQKMQKMQEQEKTSSTTGEGQSFKMRKLAKSAK